MWIPLSVFWQCLLASPTVLPQPCHPFRLPPVSWAGRLFLQLTFRLQSCYVVRANRVPHNDNVGKNTCWLLSCWVLCNTRGQYSCPRENTEAWKKNWWLHGGINLNLLKSSDIETVYRTSQDFQAHRITGLTVLYLVTLASSFHFSTEWRKASFSLTVAFNSCL